MKAWTLIFVCLVSLAAPATEIYKWVDEDGRVHYTDQPPENRPSPSDPIDSKALAQGVEPSKALKELVEQDKKDRKSRLEQRQAALRARRAERANRAVTDDYCLRARMRLSLLQEQRPVFRDEDGEYHIDWLRRTDPYEGRREYLDDPARARAVEHAQQAIQVNCRNADDEDSQRAARRQWLRSQACITEREDLRQLERPSARATRQELAEKRELVQFLCGSQRFARN